LVPATLSQRLWHWGQLAISLGLMVWIILQVDPAVMIQFYPKVSPVAWLLIVLAALGNITVQFWRWRLLIREYSTDFHPGDILPSFLAGFTFRLILPGGHAEITKIFLLPGRKRGKIVAFGLERFFQTFIKLMLIAGALGMLFPAHRLLAGMVAAGMLIVYFLTPVLPFWKKIEEKPTNGQWTFLVNLGYSLLMFMFMGIQYYLIFWKLYPVRWDFTLATVAFLWGSGLVPITISGMGVREWMASYLFPLQGIPAGEGVAAALVIFFLNSILPALVGIYFIHRHRHHLKDIPPTLRQSGHQIKHWLRSRK